MARVLVVEDEPAIAELIAMNLRHAGHEVELVADADAADRSVTRVLPDLVVLDWMLPGTSGLLLARRWRREQRTREMPIVMLTARSTEPDVVQGLDAGADDYIGKPFSPSELAARVRALLRRRAPALADETLAIGRLRLDPGAMRVSVDGSDVRLGPTEFKLLRFLMSHPERVHTRSQLLDRVWGDHVFIEERTVDVHIKRLRDALGRSGAAELIETVRGAGYRLARPAATTA
jgi:two-component system phosphate regulon response regulator PhoB